MASPGGSGCSLGEKGAVPLASLVQAAGGEETGGVGGGKRGPGPQSSGAPQLKGACWERRPGLQYPEHQLVMARGTAGVGRIPPPLVSQGLLLRGGSPPPLRVRPSC